MEKDRDIDSNNNMAEKIISQLGVILENLSSIEEFSIIPSTTNTFDRNVSPVHYVDTEYCLGLESWCVASIFKYAQLQILKLCKSMPRMSSGDNIDKLILYLNVALLIQPDVNTFWNIKRELNAVLDWENEMQFAKIVLSHKPKSLQAFTYRIWLINKQQHCDYSKLFERELIVINKAVTASANNYHGWNHRIWCIENLLDKLDNFTHIMKELCYSADFINQHVSEYSGFHYRQFILCQFRHRFSYPAEKRVHLMKYLNSVDCSSVLNFLVHVLNCNHLDTKSKARVNQYLSIMLLELFEVCQQLNIHYPGHEAIWYHRRFVFYEIITLLHKIYRIDGVLYTNLQSELSCKSDGEISPICNMQTGQMLKDSVLYNNLMSYERSFLNLLSKEHVNNSCDAIHLGRHQEWLKFRLNFDLNTNINLTNGEVLFKVL